MNATSIKIALRALGWPGLLGLGALLLAGVLELGLAQPWQSETDEAQAQAERLQRQLRLQRASGMAAEATPAQWQQALPESALRQQRLADLLELSLRAGLSSSRTEHRLTIDATAGLERLRVSMPVQGGYVQLRGFIESALRQDAALSLDSLKLRRNAPAAAEIEAELVWSLHARHGEPEGAPR
jgi:hypothetical protein